jgi:hypothetical protein
MNDQWGFDPNLNDENTFQDTTPKGLRSWAESVQKNNVALQQQLADVQKQLKAQSISSVFEDLGVPRSAASLYQGDADPEAIKSWVTNVKTAFGMGDASTGTIEQPVTPTNPLLTPEAQAQLQNFNNAGSDGRPSTGLEDAQRGINTATSVQDLIAQFQKLR